MNITSFKIVVFVLYRNVVKEYSVKHGLMFKELLKIGKGIYKSNNKNSFITSIYRNNSKKYILSSNSLEIKK